jgi:hypothetical protein
MQNEDSLQVFIYEGFIQYLEIDWLIDILVC